MKSSYWRAPTLCRHDMANNDSNKTVLSALIQQICNDNNDDAHNDDGWKDVTFNFGLAGQFVVVDESRVLQAFLDDTADFFDGNRSHNIFHQNLPPNQPKLHEYADPVEPKRTNSRWMEQSNGTVKCVDKSGGYFARRSIDGARARASAAATSEIATESGR